METEIFKDIPDYENIYQISNKGIIKSLARTKLNRGKYIENIKEKFLVQTKNSRGYLSVTLCKNGFYKQCQVHQIMAIVFFNHVFDGTTKIVVDHIDGNRLNNNLENLQLISHSKNISKAQNRDLPTGVSFDKRKNKYQARIRINKVQKHLGLFINPEEASEAYNKAYKEHYNK
jgi:hypothetical protein